MRFTHGGEDPFFNNAGYMLSPLREGFHFRGMEIGVGPDPIQLIPEVQMDSSMALLAKRVMLFSVCENPRIRRRLNNIYKKE